MWRPRFRLVCAVCTLCLAAVSSLVAVRLQTTRRHAGAVLHAPPERQQIATSSNAQALCCDSHKPQPPAHDSSPQHATRPAWRQQRPRSSSRVQRADPPGPIYFDDVLADLPADSKIGHHAVGCQSVPVDRHGKVLSLPRAFDGDRVVWCRDQCLRRGYAVFGLADAASQCWCQDAPPATVLQPAGDECKHSMVYRVAEFTPVPSAITLFVCQEGAALRTSALFLTGRLDQYFSSAVAVRKRALAMNTYDQWPTNRDYYIDVCMKTPGPKVFVVRDKFDSAHFLLQHWPNEAVFILTSDEMVEWGLGTPTERFGPHGPVGKQGWKIPSNTSSPYFHMIMPTGVSPWFRQYFSSRHEAAFGAQNVRFWPLGSRTEFETPDTIKPAKDRKYIYSMMVAFTSDVRKALYEKVRADRSVPGDRRFIHAARAWQADVYRGAYVHPSKYRSVLMDSAFSLCPVGHNIEQYRLYESIEAGAIPVVDLNSSVGNFPPAYMQSPMLFVSTWDDAIPTMLRLWSSPGGELQRRQSALAQWYASFMHDKVRELEQELWKKRNETLPFCSQRLEDVRETPRAVGH